MEAGDRQAADHAVDAALVGADAVADALAVAELVDEVGVGDHGARHRDDVAVACGERLLGDRRIVDPARGDDRDAGADRVAEPVREGQELAEAVAIAADRAGVVPGAGSLGLAHVVELARVDERGGDVAERLDAEAAALG